MKAFFLLSWENYVSIDKFISLGFSFFVVFYSRNIEYLQLVDNSLAIFFIYNQFNNCNDLWPRFLEQTQ